MEFNFLFWKKNKELDAEMKATDRALEEAFENLPTPSILEATMGKINQLEVKRKVFEPVPSITRGQRFAAALFLTIGIFNFFQSVGVFITGGGASARNLSRPQLYKKVEAGKVIRKWKR